MHQYWHAMERNFFTDSWRITTPTPQPQAWNFVFRGRTSASQDPDGLIMFMAASPPDRMTTYAGSGLPFANPDMAYENTPNIGVVRASRGYFEIRLLFPNSLYVELGKQLLPPHVLIRACDSDGASEVTPVIVGEPIPGRGLTSLPGHYTRSQFTEKVWDINDLEKYV
jgi:hypothetical protein